MKLTEIQLKKIIKESVENALNGIKDTNNHRLINDSMNYEFDFKTKDVKDLNYGGKFEITALVDFENGNSYYLTFILGKKSILNVSGYCMDSTKMPIKIKDKKSCEILNKIFYWTLDDEIFCYFRD